MIAGTAAMMVGRRVGASPLVPFCSLGDWSVRVRAEPYLNKEGLRTCQMRVKAEPYLNREGLGTRQMRIKAESILIRKEGIFWETKTGVGRGTCP